MVDIFPAGRHVRYHSHTVGEVNNPTNTENRKKHSKTKLNAGNDRICSKKETTKSNVLQGRARKGKVKGK
nr:unnamed protein product [Callosobruchus analis]